MPSDKPKTTTRPNFTHAARIARWNGSRLTTFAHGPRSNRAPLAVDASKFPRIVALSHQRTKTKDLLERLELSFRIEKAVFATRHITLRSRIVNYQDWRKGARPIRSAVRKGNTGLRV